MGVVGRISDLLVARSRAKEQPRIATFTLPKVPPGVIPEGFAMDEAPLEQLNIWAANVLAGGIFSEGLTFLGYPYLAELAQRPEYRRVIGTFSRHMTRNWIKLQAKGEEDKTSKIDRLNDMMNYYNVKAVFKTIIEFDGFFGRGHLYIDTGATDDPNELRMPIGDGRNDVSKAKVKKIVGFRAIEPVWTYPTNYNSNDPLKSDWYNPTTWFVMGKEIHATRLLRFVSQEVPDLLKPAYSFGGLSLAQMIKPYIDNWLRARQSVNDIMHSFSVFCLKTNLREKLYLEGGDEDIMRRINLFTNFRDNKGLLIVDKEVEDFANVSAPLGTLDVLQAQALEHICSISGIPIVFYTGDQPTGLNASSEGAIRAFYEWIHSIQESFLRPNLTTILNFLQLVEFGQVDDAITFAFEPLWSLTEKEQSELDRYNAETDRIRIETNVISSEEARQRVAADEKTPYAALEADEEVPMTLEKKAEVSNRIVGSIAGLFDAGIIDKATALRELKNSAGEVGLFESIDESAIKEAEEEPAEASESELPAPPKAVPARLPKLNAPPPASDGK